MKVLIFGASASAVHQLVKQSLSLGYSVTAFVRDSSRVMINDKKLSVVTRDITNTVDLKGVIKGHDAVLSALVAASPFKYEATVVDGVGKIIKRRGWFMLRQCVDSSFVHKSTRIMY